MTYRLDCEPVPSSIRSARLFVVDKLQEWRCDDLVDSVALLTSELATNAVVHTGLPYSVRVLRRGTGVRVEVTDLVRDLPQPNRVVDLERLDLDHLATGGVDPAGDTTWDDPERGYSGLGIVDRLATAWGTETVPGDGKVVWFEVEPPSIEGAERRPRVSDLSDLRSPEPEAGLPTGDPGEAAARIPRHQEAQMARHEYVVDDDDRVIEREYVEPRRGGAGRVFLVLLVIALLAVGAFFLFGGSADVDTEGDLEVPEVDVDVNAPDVDVDSSEAPPASADAG